jgi:hypothetical protein
MIVFTEMTHERKNAIRCFIPRPESFRLTSGQIGGQLVDSIRQRALRKPGMVNDHIGTLKTKMLHGMSLTYAKSPSHSLTPITPQVSASLQESMSSTIFRKDLLCSESAEMVSVLRSS